MKTEVILHFRDGQKIEGYLSRSFRSTEGEIEVIEADYEERFIFSLDELSVILFVSDRAAPAIKIREEDLAEVEVFDGEIYRIHSEIDNKEAVGFFALPADREMPWRYAFFITRGIRLRIQKRPVGSILAGSGFISDTAVNEALRTQEYLRNRRLGGIIAEKYDISQDLIETTLSATTTGDASQPHPRIGETLVAAGLVTRQQVSVALATQEAGKKKKIGTLLVEKRLISEEQLLYALATKYCLRVVDLDRITPSPEAVATLSKGIVNRLQVFPLETGPRQIVIATSNPTDPSIGDRLRFLTNKYIEFVVASEAKISAAIDRYYNSTEFSRESFHEETGKIPLHSAQPDEEDSGEVRVISLINDALLDARKKGAAAIHFEPGAGKAPLTIRYRIDNDCWEALRVASIYKSAVVSRLKMMSGLDIDERRKPQSGTVFLQADGEKIEYSLEITPTVGNQEDAVLHALGVSGFLPLAAMGFSTVNLENVRKVLAKPYGLFLCVGPAGSGKTTCLHALLDQINTPARKICTAEDPVKITRRGLRQVQVNAANGLGYSEALCSFLRADADTILVGDSSDPDTAKIVIEAALTSHLLFSTLPADSAPEAVVRLLDKGMVSNRLADALLGILAQRLVRKLCDQCKKPYHPDRDEYDILVRRYGEIEFVAHGMMPYLPGLTLMRKEGCEVCNGIGYKGKIAIHELLMGTPKIREAVSRMVTAGLLRETAIKEGMKTLVMDGIAKIFSGETDLEQLNRVCF